LTGKVVQKGLHMADPKLWVKSSGTIDF